MTAYRTIEVNGSESSTGRPATRRRRRCCCCTGSRAPRRSTSSSWGGSRTAPTSIAPDYPGFGRARRWTGSTTFDRLADVDRSVHRGQGPGPLQPVHVRLRRAGRASGSPTRHPERVQGLVLQNGNAYEAGLGPGMQALKPYWAIGPRNEAAIRGFLTLEATRSQYVDGVADPTASTRTCGSSTSATWSCPAATG